MLDRGRHSVVGVDVCAVDMECAVDRIIGAARAGRFLGVSALAVHGVMTGVLDPAHRARLNALELVLPDGQPVRWALNWLHGCALEERVSGPDLMPLVCAAAARDGLPIYLYGSRPEVLQAMQQHLLRTFPGLVIAGLRPSAFRRVTAQEQQQIAQEIAASGARIVFVGLGCPRQEVWVYEHRNLLAAPCLAVGAAFDFMAGTLDRAPEWMRRAGLEWLYRLMQEPRRLWHRYLVLSPHYLWLVAKQRFGGRTPGGMAPIVPEYYG